MGRPAITALVAVMLLASCSSPPDSSTDGAGGRAFGEATLVILAESREVQLRVEMADSPEERARGLMFREELASDAGMVFLLPEPSTGGFWMKNTVIPLSIAFWSREARIHTILDMVPCEEEPCPVYYPDEEWTGAVEVNQGFFEQHGVRVGDRVRLEPQT
jgi:uncharacterized membrane protein (UPF0127 family)